jgi:hypothetical protein
MNNVYELIETISLRTAMYTGEHKLSNIRSFIDGYTFSIKNEKEFLGFLSDFPEFHDWVARKYGFNESTVGWQNMILAVEMDLLPTNIKWNEYSFSATEKQHRSSVSKFFELIEEYKNA